MSIRRKTKNKHKVYLWVCWKPTEDFLLEEPTLATTGSLAFKRANLIKQISHAMP